MKHNYEVRIKFQQSIYVAFLLMHPNESLYSYEITWHLDTENNYFFVYAYVAIIIS